MSKLGLKFGLGFNPLETNPDYTWAGLYGKCVL